MNENIPMNSKELEIRSWLTGDALKNFDDMYFGKALGAASNIKAIATIYSELATSATNKDALLEKIRTVSDYYIEKRGKSSHAIVTAIHLMTNDILNTPSENLEELVAKVKSAHDSYLKDNAKRTQTIMEFSWNVVKDMNQILLFDYSSTVNNIMKIAHDRGKVFDVYIPESRILDGGHQFVRNGVALEHRVHYIPDANISKYIPIVDACFVGAETLYPDGSIANTAGSDLIGLLCTIFHKPLYVPTGLIKLNPDAFKGNKRTEHITDAAKYIGLQLEEELREKISIEMIGLVLVPAKDITAFITEYGVVPPSAMDGLAHKYLKELGEE